MKLYSVAGVAALAMVVASSADAADPPKAEEDKDESDVYKETDVNAPQTEEEAVGEVQPVTETSFENRVLESKVYFEFDKSELDADAKKALDQAVTWLQGNETSLILIEGHTDKVGTEGYNKGLGEARAKASMEYLLSQGVDPSRVKMISYGEAIPVIETPMRERRNRRIILYAVDKEPIVKTVDKECPTAEVKTITHTEYVKSEPDVVIVKEHKRAFNFGAVIGGGVINSISGDTRRLTDPGGMWNARFTFNTRYVVGIEAAYVGSLQDLDNEQGFGSSEKLVGNGAEGGLRLNILQGKVRPYVFGGVGWTHYNVSNVAGAEDDVLTVPAGAGLDVKFAHEVDDPGLLIDFRGTVRPVFDEDLLDGHQGVTEEGTTDLDNWSVSAQAGYAF